MRVVDLDRLVRVYGPYSRSLRIFRGLAGNGIFVFFAGPLLAFVILLPSSLLPAHFEVGLALAYMALGLLTIHVYERVAACSLFAIRAAIAGFAALALGRLALAIPAILTAHGNWRVSVPVIFGLTVNAAISWLIAAGLWPLAGLGNFERELFAVRTRERARFYWPLGALLRDVGRMSGLVIPPGQARLSLVALAAALAAFALEGTVYYTYLQTGWNVAKYGRRFAETNFPWMLALAFALVGPLITLGFGRLFFALSRSLRTAALRRSLKTAYELQREDSRAPVFLLRSFRDDQVSLSQAPLPFALKFFDPGAEVQTLEALTLRRMTAIGPVIATGNPGDAVPPIGAARAYLQDQEWQTTVGSLIAKANIVVMSLDDTPGVRWELRELAAQRALRRTLIIVPPRLSSMPQIYLDLLEEAGFPRPSAPMEAASTYIIGFLFSDDRSILALSSSKMSELEYDVALRLAIKWIRGASPELSLEWQVKE
jgi:hypothetical protein